MRQDLPPSSAPHFADVVRRWLLGWSELLGYDLYADGLVVHSAIDVRLQRLASLAPERRLDALQAVADVASAMRYVCSTADVARRSFAEAKSPKLSINELVVPAGIEGLSNVCKSRERTGAGATGPERNLSQRDPQQDIWS